MISDPEIDERGERIGTLQSERKIAAPKFPQARGTNTSGSGRTGMLSKNNSPRAITIPVLNCDYVLSPSSTLDCVCP